MEKIRKAVSKLPNANLEERENAWVITLTKENAKLVFTIPVDINELFWQLEIDGKKIFEDWADYYDEEAETLAKWKVEDCIRWIQLFDEAELFRVEEKGKFLKTKKLMLNCNGKWMDILD